MSGEGDAGILYLCGTPIGNLEDIGLRALRVLREVRWIAAEDTRRTRKLLSHYGIRAALISYHEHNERQKAEEIIGLLRQGEDVALVSDAGMPVISDPGRYLVARAAREGIRVVPVPGPSAGVLALAVSGLDARSFVFEGFLPRRRRDRRALLQKLAAEPRTLVLFEAARRARETLADMEEILGPREMVLARELTKLHEEVVRGTVAAVRREMEQRATVRGEITMVVAGAEGETVSGPRPARVLPDPVSAVDALMGQGVLPGEAIKRVARAAGLPKRTVYRAIVDRKERRAGKGKEKGT